MAWTEITRLQYRREHLRYASDTTDDEWKVIAPHPPPPADRGRTRETELRDVVNALFYIALERDHSGMITLQLFLTSKCMSLT